MTKKLLRRLNIEAIPSGVTHLYADGVKGKAPAFCGADWRYAAPLNWYLTSSDVGIYEICEKCIATEEFALAALAGV